ncbi:UDP-glucose 4-epimerase [Candidatus Fermentibacteria bacterium]|nr:MAG: UDP-glucose 4-epimerase [Candidatus Fermentibacteria bacterium]
MRVFVITGCAGFIGSTLTDLLISRNERIIGIDAFRDYYDPEIKRRNIKKASRSSAFSLLEGSISSKLTDLDAALSKTDSVVVYHLAAQAGVRKSWGSDFHIYTRDNIQETQTLLEWASKRNRLENFIYASSSSVYGIPVNLPMVEDSTVPVPHSPYGVTKLAAENLVRLYSSNMGIPSVSLRFFTVYGPRQRPDMAFNRFIRAGLNNKPVGIFSDGSQTRDFTFVNDIVNGLVLAASCTDGSVMNLGGGNRVTLLSAINTLSNLLDSPLQLDFLPSQNGDVPDTWASTDLARKKLGWTPETSLEEGLALEIDWLKSL